MAKNGLLAGTKRVDIFTGSTETQVGTQVSSSNPFPVTSVTQISTNLEGVGNLTVGTSEVEITITGTPTESIRIRADNSNTGIIFIGKTGVLSDGTNDFVRLESGDEVIMDYDDATNSLFAISDTVSQKINIGVLL